MSRLTARITVVSSLPHVQVAVDHTITVVSSLPHVQVAVDHTIVKMSEVKDFALILLISVFSLSSLHCLPKNILSNRFATLFTRWQPLTEVFIFNHKSSCCNGTFAINIAANKECLKKRRIVLKYIDSAFLQLYCLKFSSTLVDIFELRKIMKGVLLFWNTV